MTGRGLTSLHFLPQGQKLTNYYKKILEKVVQPLLSKRSSTEEPTKRKLFSNKRLMVFVQDGALAHTATAAQDWCKKSLPIFVKKEEWPANQLDLNPIENLQSIIEQEAYRDPESTTMAALESRLRKAWQKIPLSTLRELSRSVPQRL